MYYCGLFCHSEDGSLFIKENERAGICLDHMSEREKNNRQWELRVAARWEQNEGYAPQTSVNGEV